MAAPPGATRAPRLAPQVHAWRFAWIRASAGVLLAGNEEGIFRSEDGGKSWKPAGAAGYQVLHIEQSPHDPCHWLAATQGGGLFVSTDCGVSFESNGNLAVDRNISDIAFDPGSPDRIAVAGWGIGVVISEDRGKTWQSRNGGLPGTLRVERRLRSGAARAACTPASTKRRSTSRRTTAAPGSKDGLEGSRVYRMRFVPEAKRP